MRTSSHNDAKADMSRETALPTLVRGGGFLVRMPLRPAVVVLQVSRNATMDEYQEPKRVGPFTIMGLIALPLLALLMAVVGLLVYGLVWASTTAPTQENYTWVVNMLAWPTVGVCLLAIVMMLF